MGIGHPNLTMIDTFDDAWEFSQWLEGRDWVTVDTETTGLTQGVDTVRLVQVGGMDAGWAMRWDRWSGLFEDLVVNRFHKRDKNPLVMHNATFDYGMLKHMGVECDRSLIHDTRVMCHILEPNYSTALKATASRHVDFAAAGAQVELEKFITGHGAYTWATIPFDVPQYWCVPTTTEILTKRGWQKHSDVVPGDETLGYQNGVLEWTTVQSVQTFEDAPLVRLGNRFWSTECTPNHRWIMQKHGQTKLLPLDQGWKDHNTTKLVLSAPAVGGDSEITPDEAAILAWILSDGSLYWQRPLTQTSPIVCIVQHQNKFANDIRELLKRENAYTSERLNPGSNCIRFNVQATYFQRVWNKSGLREQTLSDLVLTLSVSARRAWFDAWYLAEGRVNPKHRILTQNKGPKLDALILCAYLEGYTPLVTEKNEKCCNVRLSKRQPTPQKTKVTDAGHGDVWCPVTDLQTWTARDAQGNVFVTGNTYAALDTVLTAHLFDGHWRKIQQYREAYDLENSVQFVLYDMERRGIHIDAPYATEQLTRFRDYEERLRAWALAEYNVGIGSNQAVVKVLQEEGWRFDKTTASGAVSLDKEVLEGIEHPLAQAVRRHRQVNKMASTYLRKLVDDRDGDDLIHPNINSLGARTGRMSISGPSLQNLPKKSDRNPFAESIRNCVTSRYGADGTLLMCDFDQIEMRVLAHLSKDDNLCAAFHKPEDFFVTLAREIYADPTISKSDARRGVTKNVGYAQIYGAGAEKQARMAGVAIEQVRAVKARWDALYPGVRKFQKEVEHFAWEARASTGVAYINAPLDGRPHPADEGKVYALVNYLIQGMAATMFKRSLLNLDVMLKGQYMVVPVHDEIVLDLPRSAQDDVAEVLRTTMNDATTYRVPIGASVSIGDRWGAKTDLD